MLRASQVHMNTGMERPPRNSTPIKLLANQRSFRSRRLKKKHLELQFALSLDSLPGDRRSGSEVDSILFHHRDDGSTWDDLSKYAYSEAGDLLKEDTAGKAESQQASHAMVASSSGEEADLPTAEAQALDDSKSILSYLEDSATGTRLHHHPQEDSGTSQQLHLHASLQSVTSAVMEASKECTTVTHSVQESEDLNLISLAEITHDDIMSAMDAEDSLNLQKEKEIRQQEQQQQQQGHTTTHTAKGISLQSHSTPSVNPQQSQGTTSVVNSSSKESSDLTSSRENSRATSDLTLAKEMNVRQDPPDDKKMEIVFDPNEQDEVSAVDGMGFEVHLSDLEKSILAGQARAMAAEIDSPLHIQKRNRSKTPSTSEIPSVLQEVYVPSHKRHSSTKSSSHSRRSKHKYQYDYSKPAGAPQDDQKPTRHSSLSPFVLKQCYGDCGIQQRTASAIATSVDEHDSACGSRDALKTIYSRDSEGVESGDHSSSAATQNAQRSAKRNTTGSRAGSCSRRSGATSTLATNSKSGRSHARSRDSSTRKSAASSRRAAAAAARLSQSERCLSMSNRQDSSRFSMSDHQRRRSHSETRGSSHAVPKQPGLNYNSDNDAASQRQRRARSMSRSRRRERSLSIKRTIKRVKSASCLMCKNRDSLRTLAKEETERGDNERGMLDQTERMTERDQTSAYGEYKDQVYEDIHYVMDESDEDGDDDDFEEEEDDTKTRKSRMSRTARSIKRSIGRKLSGTLSLRKFRQQPQPEDDEDGDDSSSQGRSRATRSNRRSRSRRGKQRVSLGSFMHQQEEEQDSDDQDEQDNFSRARTTTSGLSRSRSGRLSLRKFLQQSENRNHDDEGRTAVTSAVTSSVPSEPTGSTPQRSQSRRKQFAQSISRSIRASFRSTLRRTKKVRKERRKRNASIEDAEQDDNDLQAEMGDVSRMDPSQQQQEYHVGGRADEEEQVKHERDIVFDPGHTSDDSEKENSIPVEEHSVYDESQFRGRGIEIDVDEIDVDALQEIREQQEKQQIKEKCTCPGSDIMLRSCPIHGVWAEAILQHVQKQPQQQQEQQDEGEDVKARQRPSLAMTRSAVDFTSQDFTVVHNNHRHESYSFRSGSSSSLSQGGGSTRSLGVKKQRSFRSLWAESGGSKTKRAGVGERPKGPPNTRYTNQHRMSSWLKSHPDHSGASTPTRCNSRRQMLLQTRGRSTRTRDSEGSSTGSHRRSRSMEDTDRRGSF